MMKNMTKKRLASLAAPVLLLSGCAAHTTMAGTVVMRIDETKAHVCLQAGSVAVGDQVALVRHVCENPAEGRSAAQRCSPTVVGQGTVESLLNEHYAVVRFPAELAYREGDTVHPIRP